MASKKRSPKRSATRSRQAAPSPADRDPYVRAMRAQGFPEERVLEVLEQRRRPEDRLQEIAAEILELEQQRRQLLARRRDLVVELRAAGWQWKQIAAVAGVSHAALIQSGSAS